MEQLPAIRASQLSIDHNSAEARRIAVRNALVSPSGAGGTGDRTRGYRQDARPMSQFDLQREFATLYYKNWAAKKIVTIPVSDMLRERWKYDGLTPEQQKEMQTAEDRLKFIKKLGQALRLERLLGGAVILMGIQDGAKDTSVPVDLNRIGQGALKFLNVIPRNRISRAVFETNPLAAGFGEPAAYVVNGQIVHRSRLLIFDGAPLTGDGGADLMIRSYRHNDGFGESVLEALIDDLAYATGTRQAAYNLVDMASVWLLTTDVLSLEETKEGQRRLNELSELAQQVSMYRAAVMDGGPDGKQTKLQSVSPSFGSVPELVITFLQVLAAGSDIPATRFIGQAPGGLNATGDSDLENYYNSIGAKQEQLLAPEIVKFLEVAGRSTLGPGFRTNQITVEFPALWNLSETEKGTIRSQDSAAIVSMVTAGIITAAEGEAEARARDILIAEPLDIMEDDGLITDPNLDLALELDKLIAGPGDAVNPPA